ncbi:MAG: hypothetical protein WCL16_00005, partial [bacterium]
MLGQTIPACAAIPAPGRFSFGYYSGNKAVLLGADGEAASDGIMASWDRTISETSDKLRVAVDYTGGGNLNSGISFGLFWAFAKNVSMIFGYD